MAVTNAILNTNKNPIHKKRELDALFFYVLYTELNC